jgi:anthranilate phosphoribosyltransferase
MLLAVLDNQPGPALDIVLLNAGAAIYVAGVAESLQQGVNKARTAVESGAAKAKLRQLVEFSNRKLLAPQRTPRAQGKNFERGGDW